VVVCTILRKLGVVDAESAPRLEPIPRNPERRDYLTRASFRVFSGKRAICHLTVGKNLIDLQMRTRAFAEACPKIVCPLLFWHQSAGWDYLGIELVEGQNLETLVLEGRLKPADAVAQVAKVVAALEGTLLPSTAESAAQEIDRFFSWVQASPIFSGLDQQFLQSVIFPFIRSGALSGPQQTRWTNGDLIARNVLVDSRGGVRLVDYEFAGRTHFYAEDWWRWHSESKLPPEALDLPGSPKASAETWQEAYFILRHAVLIHEINGAAVAVSGLRQQMDRLVALAAAAQAGFRASVFLQPLALPTPNPAAAPDQGAARMQLYWGSDESYCEERSQCLAYPINEDAKLSFMLHSVHGLLHLRLDPAEAPGLLKISGIRVRPHKDDKPLLALDETTGWEAVRMGNGLLRLGDSPALNLLSLNSDPSFLLPELTVGEAPRDVVCEIWLRFTPDLTALPDLLRPLSSALAGRAQAEAGLAEARRTRAALEETLRIEQKKASVGRWQRFLLDKQISETQPKLQAGQQQLSALDTTVAQQQRQLGSLTAQLRQRENKIVLMQRSFSWRSTAPLRWLRRIFLNRPALPSPPSEPLQTLSALDIPSIWDAAPANAEISGWCLYPDGRPVGGIRARIGTDTILAGTYGLDREDVAKAHGFTRPDSRACGFRIRYDLPVETTHQIFLEVLGDDNQWHPLVERTLHTSAKPRTPHDYTAWIEAFDTLTEERVMTLRKRIAAMGESARPLISVIMPVYNTPERWLDRAIASVVEQVYPNWELCIADDASSEPPVRRVLEKWKNKDSRVRVVYRETNGHICAASNSALEMVRGGFVALLDHDDEIPSHALAEIALFLVEHPDTDLVYSDEDKIDENGIRSAPYFKPHFLPDLLLGQNCVSHFAAYRTELVRCLGGFRVDYEGSQDWDLALRVWDAAGAQRIRHIPKVLYHWRTIAGSTSREATAKGYTVASARSAIEDHFNRIGVKVELKSVPGNHWQIVYPLPSQPPLVSIIIPTRNQADLLRLCMATVFAKTEYPSFEIIIVDNASDDPATLNLLEQVLAEPDVRVVRYDAPFNYSAINNLAASHARGDLFCFLNNDIEVIDGSWLSEMVSHAIRPEIGAVGTMLLYPDNRIQHAGVLLGPGGVANHAFCGLPAEAPGYFNRARLTQNYSAVTSACMVVRKQVFNQVGGFNEQDLPIAFNDVDFCLRVRAAGYRNLWTPFARLCHHESISRGSENTPEKQKRFAREIDYMRQKWGPLLDDDPAYSTNLALTIPPFDLAFPPRSWAP
jgi:glycosyltransferase involved in cell wall biosynthesis